MNLYNQTFDTDIFPSFISSCSPNIDLELLNQECSKVKDYFENTDNSNRNGYHSLSFTTEKSFEYEQFNQLTNLIGVAKVFAQDTLTSKNLRSDVGELSFWVNVNKSYNYNVMHSHGRADLIGIYYVSVPEDSGNFVILRNDGSQYCNLYDGRSDLLELNLEPKQGRLYLMPGHLWHYVEANESMEDRISISFNVYLG
jgi:uncharacterized protein (TIGR02466 family)